MGEISTILRLQILVIFFSMGFPQNNIGTLNLIPLTNGETFGLKQNRTLQTLIDERYFEGDIIGPEYIINPLKYNKVNPVTRKSITLWPSAVIPYEISSNLPLSANKAILKAIQVFQEARTCLKFVTRQATDRDYILFTDSDNGCYSSIGKTYGVQSISLGKEECRKAGVIMHLVMHSLGFWHEQSRPDRDDHIKISWSSMDEKNKFNFFKQTDQTLTSLPYDHLSIMHFGQFAFSNNGKPALTSISKKWKGDDRMGQRVGFSPMDIVRIRERYCNRSQQGLSESNEDVALLLSLKSQILDSATTVSPVKKGAGASVEMQNKLLEYMRNIHSMNLPDGNALKGAGHNIDTINIKIDQRPSLTLQTVNKRKRLLVKDGLFSVAGRYKDGLFPPVALAGSVQNLDLRIVMSMPRNKERDVHYSCTVNRMHSGVVSGGNNPLPPRQLIMATKYMNARLRIGMCTWFRNMLQSVNALYNNA